MSCIRERLSRNRHKIFIDCYTFVSSPITLSCEWQRGNAEGPIARISGGAPKAEESTRGRDKLECWFLLYSPRIAGLLLDPGTRLRKQRRPKRLWDLCMRCAFEGNTPRAHLPRSHISKTRTYTLKLFHAKTRLPSSYIAIENPKPSTKLKNATHSLPCIHCLLRRLCCAFDYSVRHGNTNRASFITAVPGRTIDLGINTILEFLASARRVNFFAGQDMCQ